MAEKSIPEAMECYNNAHFVLSGLNAVTNALADIEQDDEHLGWPRESIDGLRCAQMLLMETAAERLDQIAEAIMRERHNEITTAAGEA